MPICVLEISKTDSPDLSPLYQVPGVTFSQDANFVYVKVPYADVDSDQEKSIINRVEIKSLSVQFSSLSVFNLSDDDRLIPFSKTVPVKNLPDLKWDCAEDFFQIDVMTSGCVVGCIDEVSSRNQTMLKLVRSPSMKRSEILHCGFQDFRDWVFAGLECRFKNRNQSSEGLDEQGRTSLKIENRIGSKVGLLDSLHYILIHTGEALVFGRNLPPLAGKYFYFEGNIAIEAGWCFSPDLDSPLLQNFLQPNRNVLQVHSPTLGVFDIRWDQLVPVSRSSVRKTEQYLKEGEKLL